MLQMNFRQSLVRIIPDEEVTLKIFRDGNTIDKSVKLKPRDEKSNQSAQNTTPKESASNLASKSFESIGISVSELSDAIKG